MDIDLGALIGQMRRETLLSTPINTLTFTFSRDYTQIFDVTEMACYSSIGSSH